MRKYPLATHRLLVQELPELCSWALCERLCAESSRQAAHSAAAAVGLAEIAIDVAALVPGGNTWRQRVSGYAWAFVGNARCVANNLTGSEEAFARSRVLWHRGAPGDPGSLLDGTRLLGLEASLHRAQRRFPESLALLDEALARRPSGELKASILIKKAKTLEEMHDYATAVAVLREAEPLVDSALEPRLAVVLRANLANYLFHLGDGDEADRHLAEAQMLAAPLGNHLDFLRLRWLENRAAASRGKMVEATRAIAEIANEFAHCGMEYDAALVNIDLASLLLDHGRIAEAKQLASQSASIFHTKGVSSAAQTALDLFRRASER
jgi:tetratricopeptide (TPR) repeat protein